MFLIVKKRIVVDTSGEEIRRVTNLLDQHHITYELRTKRTRGSIGTALDSMAYAASNIAMYKGHQRHLWSIWYMSKEVITPKLTICFIDSY